jgi:F-type H+-transporting ATPase subunit b
MLINWFTVAAQAVNFLLLVWLLKRFLYRPILAAIDAREKRIATQQQEADTRKAEALRERTELQQQKEAFEGKRAALLAEATQAAAAEREKLLAAARTESDALRAKLQKAIRDERDGLSQKLGALAQREVFSIARKALGDLAGAGLEERIADVFIRRLQGLDDRQRAEFQAGPPSSGAAVVRSAFALADPQRTAVAEAVHPLLPEGTALAFETKPELVGGIELAAGGQKIGWSIADYLASLTRAVDQMLELAPAPVPPSPQKP